MNYRNVISILFLVLVSLVGCQPPGVSVTPVASPEIITESAVPAPTVTSIRANSADARPNFVIIVSDDQRFDTMEYMPLTQQGIFDQGVTFANAFVTTPRCCPSRSSILTGLYAHNHGVLDNDMPLTRSTIVETLRKAGYFTGLVGKYLNSYPNVGDPPKPEFDYWIGMATGPNAQYYNPTLSINGPWEEQEGYQTYILRDYAVEFIRQAADQGEPFFLLFAPYAPHRPATPAPGDVTLYSDLPPFRPPSFNEEDISDKPLWLQDFPLLTEREIEEIDDFTLNQLRSLKSLDHAVASIMDELSHNNLLENTVVIYLSDNGHGAGEHRIPGGKIYAYDEYARVPMAMRYPPVVGDPVVNNRIVGNIDLAPTILELAGLPIPEEMDGVSLLNLFADPESWRTGILIEGWPGNRSPNYTAIRTDHYLYIETEGDIPELYDLREDPYALTNVATDSANASITAELAARLAELRNK